MDRLLEIADKNGFDWFGYRYRPLIDTFKYCERKNSLKAFTHVKTIMFGPNEGEIEYSLADLSCNKSFLEALAKIKTTNERLSLPKDMFSYRNLLAMRLNNDLIFKNGQNFVKICNEFIGE